MNKKKSFSAILIGVFLMILAVVGATYAYFTATISDGDKGSSVIIRTGTLRLVYQDTEYINVSGILPGESYSKVVTVTNEGNVPVYYHLVWIELLNEFETRSDLTMEISCTSNTDTCDGLSNTVVSESGTTIPIIYNVEIGMLETHTYTITIHFNETGSNQNDNQGKIISGKIGIIEARDLAIDLYGYVYDGNGDPVSSAMVELHSDPVSVVTDANGRYEISGLPLGTHTAYVKTSDGTSTIKTTSMSLQQGKTTTIESTNVTLSPTRQTIGININVGVTDNTLQLVPKTSGTLMGYNGNAYYNANYSTLISKIIFEDEINIPADASSSWDVSEEQDGGVMAYMRMEEGRYVVHIQSEYKIYAPADSHDLFGGYMGLTNVSEIVGLSCLDTSRVTNMEGMFSYKNVATNLDLSNFNTSNVTDMSWMFAYSQNLTQLNLNNFNTSKVTNMSFMFRNATNLSSLKVDNFDTSKVTTMESMFENDYLLKNINLRSFTTPVITQVNQMFLGDSLTTLDIRNATFSQAENYASMFSKYINTGLTVITMNAQENDFIEARLDRTPCTNCVN